MSDPEPYYVYVYRDPRPGKRRQPIYVGKGKNGRAYRHLKGEAGNPHLRNKLNKIRAAGLEPMIRIVRRFKDEKAALKYEKQLVKKYGRVDLGTGPLCNYTDGGEAPLNFGPVLRGKISAANKQAFADPEVRERLSATSKKVWTDPEMRARHSAALKQAWADPEARACHSATLKQAWADPEIRARLSAILKPIYADPEVRARRNAVQRQAWADPEARARNSARLKQLWADPEYRERFLAGKRRKKAPV
jgi:hypothetical protein